MSKSELPLDEEKKPAKKERRRARGSGHVYERGGTLWIQYRIGGRRFRESAHTDKWTVAGDLLHRRITEAQDGIVRPGRIAYESLRDALYSDYLTRRHKSLLTRAETARGSSALYRLRWTISLLTTEPSKSRLRQSSDSSVSDKRTVFPIAPSTDRSPACAACSGYESRRADSRRVLYLISPCCRQTNLALIF
jgi:hypothetical protein